jgi:heme oxygenase
MANMTLSIPDDVHKQMRSFPEISWSEVARQAIAKRIEREAEFRKLLKQAKEEEELPEELRELGRRINKVASDHLRDVALRRHEHSYRGGKERRAHKSIAARP